MYKSASQRKEDDKRAALLLLFIYDRDLTQEFTEFYKRNKDRPLEEVEKELKSKKKLKIVIQK